MAHFRRGRPKSARAGCMMCKPNKHQANRHRARAQGKREAVAEVEDRRPRRQGGRL